MNNKTKSIMLFTSKVINVIVTLLTIMIISRKTVEGDYANYRIIVAAIPLVTAIFSLGIPNSILYFMSDEKSKNKYYINIIISILLVVMFYIITNNIISISLDKLYNTNIFIDEKYYLMLLTILSLFNISTENVFIAYSSFKLIFINTVIPNLTILLFLLLSYKISIKFLIIILIIKETIKFLIVIIHSLKLKLNLNEVSIKIIKEILIYTMPLSLSMIIVPISSNFDKIIATNFLSKADFIDLTNGSFEIPLFGLITASVYSILIADMKKSYDKNDNNNLVKIWKSSGEILITIIVPIGMGIIVFSDCVISILFSQRYISCKPIFIIYQISSLTRIYVYGSFFLAIGRSKLYSMNVILSILINMALSFTLMKIVGVIGIALANVTSNIILIILQNYQISKITNIKSSQVYPYYKHIKGIIISFMVCLTFKCINNYLSIINLKSIYSDIVFMSIAILISMLVCNILIDNTLLKYIKIKINKYLLRS